MASYLNPFSENFVLKTIISDIGELLDYINPFSENFILKDVTDFVGSILDYINPFSENFFAYKLLELLGNLLKDLFVPTEEQWADLEKQDEDLQSHLESKFPLVYWFQDELKKADEYVYSDDFLNIKMPAWHMDLGVIKYDTEEFNFTAVRDAYAPYRVTIRNSLFVIAVGLAIVYIIKYLLNYSVSGSSLTVFSNSSDVSGGDKK